MVYDIICTRPAIIHGVNTNHMLHRKSYKDLQVNVGVCTHSKCTCITVTICDLVLRKVYHFSLSQFKSTSSKCVPVVGLMTMMADDPEHPDVFLLTDSEHGECLVVRQTFSIDDVCPFFFFSANVVFDFGLRPKPILLIQLCAEKSESAFSPRLYLYFI